VDEAREERHSLGATFGLTALGIVVIRVGGALVAQGAERIVAILGVPALMMSMVIRPAAIEREEVSRQAANLGLIALLVDTPHGT
jgi:Ca2+/Na+ antiporter